MASLRQDPVHVPSILHTPEEASALTCEEIQGRAKRGLDLLGERDARFNNFKRGKNREENGDLGFSDDASDLFSPKTVVDRRLLSKSQIDWINESVSSYLRLLSNYLHLRDALETLEYLIRIYSIHQYSWEDVLLCSLPYHEERTFVRIVELLPVRNTKWEFLHVVALTRQIIIKKCMVDMQVLQSLCAYVHETCTKKYPPSPNVFTFTLNILVGVVARIPTVHQQLLNTITPFLDKCLQSGLAKSLDHKAGALIIVGMLAQRRKLESDHFIKTLVNIAEQHSKDPTDHWLRLSFVALVNFVQLQSITDIPKSLLHRLNKLSGISGLLLNLSKEFNLNKFLEVLLDSFIRSSSDAQCCNALLSIIATVPVDHLISGVFLESMTRRGAWCTKILSAINQKYSSELVAAIRKFLQDTEVYTKEAKLEMLGIVVDFLESDMWLHCSSERENDILRQLGDDDLAVVQAALSSDQLPAKIVTSAGFLDALLRVVQQYTEDNYLEILESGVSDDVQLVVDVLALSLKNVVSNFGNQADSTEKVTSALLSIQQEVVNSFENIEQSNADLVLSRRLCKGLEDLFFFLTTTQSHDVFAEHLQYRMEKARACPVLFQSQLIAREDVDPLVRIESLRFFENLCSNSDWSYKILSRFPTLLVPLLSDNEELKGAAFECIEKLVQVRGDDDHINDEFLRKLVEEKDEVLSSRFLSKYLNSTYDSLEELDQRFMEFAKHQNLISIIRLCAEESQNDKLASLLSTKRGTKRTHGDL